MPTVIPAYVPSLPGYREHRPMDWRRDCACAVAGLIRDYPFQSRQAPHFSYYTVDRRNRIDQLQVLQVYDHSWTLHVQCALHEDVDWTKEYVSRDDLVISIDVEKGPRNRFDAESVDLRFQPLQDVVHGALSPIVMETLGLDGVPKRKGARIVWETIEFSPHSEESIKLAAERMAAYFLGLMITASQTMDEWAARYNVHIMRLL